MREYVANQFRTHQVTSKRVCRSEEELKHLGESYLCLLQNARQHEVSTFYIRHVIEYHSLIEYYFNTII